MYTGYVYPFYRSPYFGYGGFGPGFGPGYGGYSGFGGYGYGSNIIGSAIANQSVVNTGNIAGFTQTATPTVIW